MLSESLVPDEPLRPSSTPESQGSGPSHNGGEYQDEGGAASKPAVASASSAAGSADAGIGNSAGCDAAVTSVAAAAGGCQGSEGAGVSAPGAADDCGGASTGAGLDCRARPLLAISLQAIESSASANAWQQHLGCKTGQCNWPAVFSVHFRNAQPPFCSLKATSTALA